MSGVERRAMLRPGCSPASRSRDFQSRSKAFGSFNLSMEEPLTPVAVP